MTLRDFLAGTLGGCLFLGWCWVMLGLIYMFGPMLSGVGR